MLYTLGHRKSYEQYFAEQDAPMKLGRGPYPHKPGQEYPGGSVFLTVEDAAAACPDGYVPWGLATTIDNTYLVGNNRHLIETAPLVRLS